MSDKQRLDAREPHWQPIGMLPAVTGMVWRELEQVNELVRDLSQDTSTPIAPGLLGQLAERFDDDGAWHRMMAQQLARWRHDHPEAEGLDEFAELVADLEPCRHRLLEAIGRHRRQR